MAKTKASSDTVQSLKLLGERLRSLRIAQGLSQAQVADSIGMSAHYLSEVEAGKRNVSILCLEALAKRLSVSLPELLRTEEHQFRETILRQLHAALEKMPLDNLLFLQRAFRILNQ